MVIDGHNIEQWDDATNFKWDSININMQQTY